MVARALNKLFNLGTCLLEDEVCVCVGASHDVVHVGCVCVCVSDISNVRLGYLDKLKMDLYLE